ncbi:hypothetical protein [Cohnella sp.]|uniref:hypothetical protein n=1 Tax=Cohnella sp. TaxID=1883426 RepID=UPI003567F106
MNDKIMPIDRGEFYEDPLDDFLQTNNYGEITGGGTMQAQSGEIGYCDIEILIYNGNDYRKVIGDIANILEDLGAPKGSHITIENTKEQITFGKKEGIAIYLDGINLPNSVYEQSDSNVVLEELSKLISYDGDVQRYWQGNTETALYFYGDSFDEMKNAISEFISTYPLCQNARIFQIA